MKSITIRATTPGYSGGLKQSPLILFAPSLLNDGYSDIVDNLAVSGGGGGTISLTKQNVDTIGSFNTQNNMLGNQNGVFNQLSNVARNLNTTSSSFAPVIQPPSGVLDSFAQGDGTPSFNAPDLDKIQSLGTPTTAVTSVTASSTNNVVTTSTSLVVSDNVTKDLTTNNVDVVTDATISGGGSTNLNEVVYTVDGDTVNISGDGYKRFLNDLYSKKRTIKKVRVTIKGTDVNFNNNDVFSLTSKVINLGADEKSEAPFSLIENFSPRNVQGNIVDLDRSLELKSHTALLINAYFSPTVEYFITVWY